MYDANLVDFYKRVAHFEGEVAMGRRHAAPGTFGFMAPTRRKARARIRVLPLLLVASCAILLKASILFAVGPEAYQNRVERLNGGEGFDRLGGWLMQVDPVTEFVADKFVAVKIASGG